MAQLIHPLVVLALVLVQACDACGATPVPFKREPARSEEPETETAPVKDTFVPRQGTHYAEPRKRIELGDLTVHSAEDELRAALAVDLDADGELDALVVRQADDETLSLGYSMQRDGRLGAPTGAQELLRAPGCEVASISLRAVAEELAVISSDVACEQSEPTASGRSSWRQQTVVRLGRTPRLWQRFEIQQLTSEVRVADQDEDGHADVVLELGRRDDETERLTLVWLDRPGALSWDSANFRASLQGRVEEAAALVERDPGDALELVEATLGWFEAVCQGAGEPLLRVGARAGLACGRPPALQRARALRVVGRAEQGQLWATLRAFAELARSNPTNDNDKLARQALSKLSPSETPRWVSGPAHRPPPKPEVRRSAIAFVNDEQLLLRGTPARTYDLSTGELSELQTTRQWYIEDPEGRRAVIDVRRDCEGYRLHLIDVSRIVAGIPVGKPDLTPLVQQRALVDGMSCDAMPARLRDDDGGYRVLDWVAGGVVVDNYGAVKLVPVSEGPHPSGDPRPLGRGDLPLTPGVASSDGLLALSTPAGIVLQHAFGGESPRLVRPGVWSAGKTHDVSISPSGQKLAFVADGKVWIGLRAQ